MNFAIGQGVPRTEDPRLLKGQGRYADDFNLPHQAYMVVVRSPHAHAAITHIDAAAAQAMPGVIEVLTGADYESDGMGEIVGPSPHKRRDGTPMQRPPRPALSRHQVHHVGQPVALVIAETAAQARDASEAVDVSYESFPVVVSTGEANSAGQPEIWSQAPSNEMFVFNAGDADACEAAIANAAHVIRNRFVISRLTTNAMEPRAALGAYDPGEERYTLYVGAQRPYAWRTTMTRNIFHVDEHQLRIVTGDVGGSFGLKGAIHPEVPLVAWAAKRVGRPVKWTGERSEGFVGDDHARDNVSEAELALDEDGRFKALRVRTRANLGAYVSFFGPAPPTGNIGTLAGTYTTPAMHVEVTGVMTNTAPLSPYRGAGRPEAAYVIERMVSLAAAELDLDPVEIRRRNFIAPGDMPFKTGLTFT